MKKLIFILAALAIAGATRAQNSAIDEMFRRYSEKDGFTLVTISSRMFSMISNLASENEDADNIIGNLKSIRILSVSDSLLNKNLNFYTELSRKLDLKVYEELMVVKEGADITKFLIRESGNRVSELLIITGGPGGNSLISIQGNLSMKNISDLSKSVDIKELDGLEGIENRQK